MPKINIDEVAVFTGVGYPDPLSKPCIGRAVKMIGDAGGLTQFGADHVTLPPGVWASQRHWHSAEDEFVYVLSGHPTLIDDHGETQLKPGDACTHKAGNTNAHHLINRTDQDVTYIVVGTRSPNNDHCHYPDINLDLPINGTDQRVFSRKDGTPY